MKVLAVRAFVGKVGSDTIAVRAGQELDLPEGVDWLQAGFVVPVDPPLAGTERAVVAKPTERRKKATGA